MRWDVEAGATWHAVIVDLLARVNFALGDELPDEINKATAPIGLDVTVYLVDHEQRRLWPLPRQGKPPPPPMSVDGSLAGRAFASVHTQVPDRDAVPYRMWLPLIDGAERLGVVEVLVDPPPADPARFQRWCESLVGLLGHLVTVKMPYGDTLHRTRRTRAMSAAGELLTQLLPPLTFSAHRLSISAVLEPCYDVGGDAFDYAVDGPVARMMVLDAMGRGLGASLTCATALGALRAARRDDHGLYAMARAADAALIEQFPDLRFVTGVLTELNMDSGLLRYINAGHPAPLLMRGAKAVRDLPGGRRLPLGIEDSRIVVGEEILEPGDRLLLYTDGVVEAYDQSGDRFGVERLVDLAERCAAAGMPGPETLRRLAHTVLAHQDGPPTDDATLLLLEWSPQAAERTQL
ncbi:serine/threonine-protein phosphatase [Micromonospora sp. CPCC 205371]|nr:serine/threonine-protein phosphatase [Micromonospora sp. CPCC 205371]